MMANAPTPYPDLSAPGTRVPGPPASDDRRRAIAVARVILRAPNMDHGADVPVLAREFLRVVGQSV